MFSVVRVVRGSRTSNQILDEDEWHVGLSALVHEGLAVTRVDWDDHQLDDLSSQRLRHYTHKYENTVRVYEQVLH